MKKIKNFIKHPIFKLFWLFIIISSLITALFVFISAQYNLMGLTNSVNFTTALLLAFLWLTFASSRGVFDMLVYGVKSFIGGFRKKYEKLDFYEYTTNKKMPEKNFYIALALALLVFIILSVILLAMTIK